MLKNWLARTLRVVSKLATAKGGKSPNHEMPKSGTKFDDFFVTLYLRPKNPTKQTWFSETGQDERIAIVLQGPLISEGNYTYRTAQAYRSWFPNSPIVFSTWDNENAADLEAIRKLGCHVLTSQSGDFSEREAERGQTNVNRQMRTSHSGLLVAKDLGAEFALKTRSDQRICNPQAVRALPGLMETFRVGPDINQLGRIVVTSLNTFALRLYGLSDMFMFGFLDDLIEYWDGTLDKRATVSPEGTLRQYAQQRIAEVFFASSFLERKGEVLEWTLAHYWSQLSRRFLVVDSAFVDQHWPKYTDIENRWAWRNDPKFVEVTFATWIAIREGRLIPDETLLDTF